MSEAYERERQNNARLDELSAKVSALRGVTIDIYDNVRAQDVIDSTVRCPGPPMRGTAAVQARGAELTFLCRPIPSPPCPPRSRAPRAA